jgi:CRISPR-associated protein Cas2
MGKGHEPAHPKRRRKLSDWLDGFGDRVQESVFELPVAGSLAERCLKHIPQLIDPNFDNIVIYKLCGACEAKRTYLGVREALPGIGDEEVFIV